MKLTMIQKAALHMYHIEVGSAGEYRSYELPELRSLRAELIGNGIPEAEVDGNGKLPEVVTTKAQDLKAGDRQDLEGCEFYTDKTDIEWAEQTVAVVDGELFFPKDGDGVLVHFEDHVSLFVPLDYEFKVQD